MWLGFKSVGKDATFQPSIKKFRIAATEYSLQIRIMQMVTIYKACNLGKYAILHP